VIDMDLLRPGIARRDEGFDMSDYKWQLLCHLMKIPIPHVYRL
jgi:hypothetical protein